MWVGLERSTLRASANEEIGTLTDNTPHTGHEPKSSTTTTSQRPLKSSCKSPPVTTPSAERFLHHCSLWSERQAYHSPDESLLSSQSLSVGHVRTGRPVNEFGSPFSNVREDPCRDSENEQIRILLERQKEQILASCRAEIHKHDIQADYDRRNIQKKKWSYRVSTR